MVNQKLISFKMDVDSFSKLDSLCSEYGFKRNAMLNILVRTGYACLSDKKAKYAIMASLNRCLSDLL